jgi:hypothetical protein
MPESHDPAAGRPGWPDPGDLAALHDLVTRYIRAALVESRMMDDLDELLEARVAALEEIAAARWPASIGVRRRLRRALRRSVAHMPGETFADRRTEAAGAEFLSRYPRGGAR